MKNCEREEPIQCTTIFKSQVLSLLSSKYKLPVCYFEGQNIPHARSVFYSKLFNKGKTIPGELFAKIGVV